MKKSCYSPVMKVIAVLLIITMLPVYTAFAYAPSVGTETGVGTVDSLVTEELVPGAVTYSNFTCTNPNKQDVYVVEVDTSKGFVPVVTYGENINSKETVKKQAEREIANGKKIYAAINTDFYTLANGESWGLTIKDGELLGYTNTKKAIAFTKEGKAVIGRAYIDINVACEGEDLGSRGRIEKINKLIYTDGCYLFNSEMPEGNENILDSASGGVQTGYTRIKLKKISGKAMIGNSMTCQVLEIVSDVKNYDLPKLNDGEYYIMYRGVKPNYVYKNVYEGDELTISFEDTSMSKYSSPEGFVNCVEGVGIENTILENGEIVNPEYTFVGGVNPRTVLGVKEDGTIVIVCIDGRSDKAYGAVHKEAGQLLKDLGCSWGVNFDGGGSTTLLTSTDGKNLQLRNTPSDGAMRSVTAALCIAGNDTLPSVDKKEQTVDLSNITNDIIFTVDKNGNEVSGEFLSNVLDYVTVSEDIGDKIIYTFEKDFMQYMVVGKHNFSVDFKDGSKAEFTLNVTNTKNYLYEKEFWYDTADEKFAPTEEVVDMPNAYYEFLKLIPSFNNDGKGIVIPYNKQDGDIKSVTFKNNDYPAEYFEKKEIGNTSYLIISDELISQYYGKVVGNVTEEAEINFTNGDVFKVNIYFYDSSFERSAVSLLSDENYITSEITYTGDDVDILIDNTVSKASVFLETMDEYALYADPGMKKEILDKVNFKENTTVIYAKSYDGKVRKITIRKSVNPVNFTDVPKEKWYASYLDKVNKKGLITGYDYDKETNSAIFDPEKNATRIEGFIFILRMLGIDSTQYSDIELPFADYDENSSLNAWSKDYVKAAYGLGLVKGTQTEDKILLNGNGNITRGEFFAAYARALMISDTSEDYKETDFDKFNDKEEIEKLTWFENEFKYLVYKGILEGDDSGNMSPGTNVQRCHIVKMLAMS